MEMAKVHEVDPASLADDALRRASLRDYEKGLRELPKYAAAEQLRLKTRVFETFDQFLRHCGHPGLLPGMRLVDLGGAAGDFSAVCRERGLTADAFDASQGIDLEQDRVPVDSASADVVTAISVIEHLRSPAMMLSEAQRMLKAGGALILVCPNWRYSMRDFYDDPTHVHPYTERSLARALANAGYGGVKVVPWLVKKPAWLWDVPGAFFAARWLIPFRGTAPRFVPGFLKGRSSSLLALGVKARAA